MICEIKNTFLTVQCNTKGACLWSIQDKNGKEFLWQGDSMYWSDRAPVLFPYIARLTQKKYTYKGKSYEMEIHGFAKDREFLVEQKEKDSVKLVMEDDEKTRLQYPFRFRLEVCYSLCNRCIKVMFRVFNKDDKTMYFGIGGHPGFFVPIEKNLTFNDYYLEFSQASRPKKIKMSEDCFVLGEEDFCLINDKILCLKHELFNDDAIILKETPKEIALKSQEGMREICIRYPQMSYLGIWHKPKSNAPYICLEPWSSLPSRKNVIEDLEEQKDLQSLPVGKMYENLWEIEIF